MCAVCCVEEDCSDINVFFNKYVHELVTIHSDFIDAMFNYEKIILC